MEMYKGVIKTKFDRSYKCIDQLTGCKTINLITFDMMHRS